MSRILSENGSLMLSQSIMKGLGFDIFDGQLQEFEVCPRLFKYYYVDDNQMRASEPMNWGVYFESQCIGGGRGGKAMQSWEMPRLQSGDKSLVHKRIDAHIREFKPNCEKLGLEFSEYNTQMPLIAKYSNKVFITGVCDIFPCNVTDNMAIVDLKYTKNVNSSYIDFDKKYSFSSAWGNYQFLSKIQAITYRWMAKNLELRLLHYYWDASGYSREQGFIMTNDFIELLKDIPVDFYWYVVGSSKWSTIDEQFSWIKFQGEVFEDSVFDSLVQSSVRKFVEMRQNDFPEKYIGYVCNGCPLKLECKTYLEKQ